MPYQRKVILLGGAAVLGFDLVASLASRSLGFDYSRASIGSFVLYFAVGYFAARGATTGPLRHAAMAGAAVGLVDASLGWAISSTVGPGRPSGSPELTVWLWAMTAMIVMGGAAVIAVLGGLAGRRRRPIDAPAG